MNENESIFILQRLMCVFDCERHRPKFIQGLKMRQKKIKNCTACTQSGCWTMHSNPVQTGVWHIQFDTIANGFN